MAGEIKLSKEQMLALKRMGFCDPALEACDGTDDGVVSIDDQRSVFTILDGYKEAFMNLANLGGTPKAIDANDFAKLANTKVLAEVIAGDPAYDVIKSRQTALEYKKKEVDPKELHPGLPPRHFKRFAYYLQMALAKTVDPSLVPDGVFGDETRRVAGIFQQKLKIKENDGTIGDGEFLGPMTVGAIIMRCRYSKAELVAILKDDEFFLEEHAPFIIDSASGNGHTKVRDHVVIALKWLGYIDESVTADDKYKFEISSALSKKFDGAMLVGPIVIRSIIDRIENLDFKPSDLK